MHAVKTGAVLAVLGLLLALCACTGSRSRPPPAPPDSASRTASGQVSGLVERRGLTRSSQHL